MLEDTYAHTPIKKMFDLADVYGIGYDEERSSRVKVRLGIIGAGGVAQSKHLPAINRLITIWEQVEVPAISIRREEQGKKVAELYNCRWYPDYQKMIREEKLDGVLVLTPDEYHAEHSIACLDEGLHVLVEKPITRSLVDSMKLCRYADEKGLILMTVSNKRYSPPYRRAKHFIDEGPVTNPALFVGKFNLGYKYVDLFETGTIHIFDMTRYLMGDVTLVNAVGVNKYKRSKYPVDNVISTFEYASGSVGSIYTSSSALSLKPWERVEVYGDGSWLAVEDQNELILYDSETGPTKSWKPTIPNTMIFDEEFAGFMGLIENFLQTIRGLEKPLVTGWDGHYAYELAVASHLSLSRKESVRLPLDPESADTECNEWLNKR